jgi:glyceraldehyde 3-phosphate dehydrogenase
MQIFQQLSSAFEGHERSSMKTFGINGFGRIGRTTFRVWWQKHGSQLDLRVINTSGSMELEEWVHLLKYDSNYGPFTSEIGLIKLQSKKEVSDDNPVLGTLAIDDREIVVTAQRDPAKIPWGHYGVQTVIESTGHFTSQEKAQAHLQGGAQKVLISAPPKGGSIETGIIGLNSFTEGSQIVSNASCTTNSVAPVAQVLHSAFGIRKATLTTIHSYTDDQNLHDNSHKDLRRARAAAQNIVPTTTGAAISVTEVIPELRGLFDGLAVRVPTAVGSLSDMTFLLNQPTTVAEVNQALVQASQQDRWRGILAVTNEPLVSSDIKGRPESTIVDLSLTQVIDGDLVKVVSWYDNEWGYCNRLVEQLYYL